MSTNDSGLIELQEGMRMRSLKRNPVQPGGIETGTGRGLLPPKTHYPSQELCQLVIDAARNGNPQELEALLADGVSPNVIDVTGKSPLHLAVSTGKKNCPK